MAPDGVADAPRLTSSTPLTSWNESTVLRYLASYRGGRVAQSTLALVGPLCNGRELARRHGALHDEDLSEAVQNALRDPRSAWEECAGGFECASAGALELGLLSAASAKALADDADAAAASGHYVALGGGAAGKGREEEEDPNASIAFPALVERPGPVLSVLLLAGAAGVALCLTVFSDALAERAGYASTGAFRVDVLKFASIPVGTTLFTWVHVWLALGASAAARLTTSRFTARGSARHASGNSSPATRSTTSSISLATAGRIAFASPSGSTRPNTSSTVSKFCLIMRTAMRAISSPLCGMMPRHPSGKPTFVPGICQHPTKLMG